MKRFLTITILLAFVSNNYANDSLEGLFNQAIQNAKKVCGIKSLKREMANFKECVDKNYYNSWDHESDLQGCNSCIISELATRKEVADYINRPADQITFNKLHEPVIDNKYEQELYESMPYPCASYRGLIRKDGKGTFYTVGLDNKAERFLESKFTSEFADTKQVSIYNPRDIYGTREFVNKHEKTDTNMAYVNMNGKDRHAFASLIKFSPTHDPITFLMNTGTRKPKQRKEYYDYLEYRYNLDWHNRRGDDALDKARNKKRWGSRWGDPLPFVDASHNLQRNDNPSRSEDGNCGLYTYNFTNAMADYLLSSKSQSFESVCAEGKHEEAAELLREGMKPHLPMYYDCSGGVCTEKPRDLIEKHHRDLRWEIGGHVLMNDFKKIAQNQKTT